MINIKKFITLAGVLLTAAASFATYNPTNTKYVFGASSPLSTGRWVRISIKGSGMYEISYDRLREMGFSDPSKVAVYGKGGLRLNYNFIDYNNNRLTEDNIEPIATKHMGDKLIFYGNGDRYMKFKKQLFTTRVPEQTYQTEVYRFARESFNTWSEDSYYLLTDSHPIAEIQTSVVTNKEEAADNASGYGCVYHELELDNGGMGNNWWGEWIDNYDTSAFDSKGLIGNSQGNVFEVEGKYCIPASNKANRGAVFSADALVNKNQGGYIYLETNGTPYNTSMRLSNYMSATTTYCNSNRGNLTVDDNHRGHGYLKLATKESWGVTLDYWTLAYPVSLAYTEDDPEFDQFEAGFPGKNTPWKHPIGADAEIWDITDPVHPVGLEVSDGYFYSNNSSESKVVAFDPASRLRQINDYYEEVRNQDLHAYQNTPADMLIITVPAMRKYADRIAELHKQYKDENVVVVNHQQIYDEFNGGTPDPTACRLMAKMLYQSSGTRFKNILFLGPIHGDYRNLRRIPNRIEGMIGYENDNPDLEEYQYLAMNYYGIMADNYEDRSLQLAPIAVGVGLLPISSDQDGQLAVNKIRRHLEKEDFSGMVNESMGIGCGGDMAQHQNQIVNLNATMHELALELTGGEYISDVINMDLLMGSQGNTRIMTGLDRGKFMMYYMGHAVANGFGGFSMSDAMNLKNKEMGIAFFGGCDLSSPNAGINGMGDMCVTRTANGFIGAIGSTHTVMSNHNYQLANNLIYSLMLDDNGRFRSTTPSIGEVYARAQDRTSSASAVSYILVGDPLLRLPIALKKIKVSVPDRGFRSGEVVEISGEILNKDNTKLTDYNGFVTVKLMQPSLKIPEQEAGGGTLAAHTITDLPILAVNGKVKNGKFTVKFPLPEDVDAFLSDADNTYELPVFAGTWDNTQQLGASGKGLITMAAFDAEDDGQSVKDEKAPVITVSYDELTGLLHIKAEDNVGLMPGIGAGSGISVAIDGRNVEADHDKSADVAVLSWDDHVDVIRLTRGNHEAVVTATDLVGNTDSKTLRFEIKSNTDLKLSVDDIVATDNASFKISGKNTSNLQMLIMDSKGNIVADNEVSGNTYDLDTTDLQFGTYRAFVRSNSAAGSFMKSNSVEFTVID